MIRRIGICARGTGWSRGVAIVLSVWALTFVLGNVDAKAQSQTGLTLTLLGTEDRPANLRYLTTRSFVTDYDADGPVVSTIEIGCRLGFTAAVMTDPTVRVELDLHCSELAQPVTTARVRTPLGPRLIQQPEVTTSSAVITFEASDGQTIELDQDPGAPPIFATPRIIQSPDEAEATKAILLQLFLPDADINSGSSAPEFREQVRTTALANSAARIRDLTRRHFLTEVTTEGAAARSLETGCMLDQVTQITPSEALISDLAIGCVTVDESVPTFRVRANRGSQIIDQPVTRRLHLETSFSGRDGQTLTLGGISSADEEALVFATPRAIAPEGASTLIEQRMVLLEALVLRAGRGSAQPSDAMRFAQELRVVGLETTESVLRDTSDVPFVIGIAAGDPVTAVLEDGCTLRVTPGIDAENAVTAGIEVSCDVLTPPVRTIRVHSPNGVQRLELPRQQTASVQTEVRLRDGQTIVLGGITRNTDREILFFITPRIVKELLEGAAPMVFTEARAVGIAGDSTTASPGHRGASFVEGLNLVAGSGETGTLQGHSEQFLITGIANGEPQVGSVEEGCSVVSTPAWSGIGNIAVDATVTCRTVDSPVETERVRTIAGAQWIDLPVVHTFEIKSSISTADGQTLALGGAIAEGKETLAFVTLSIVDAGNILQQSRILKQVEGDAANALSLAVDQSCTALELTTVDGVEASFSDLINSDFPVARHRGQLIFAEVDTGVTLSFLPQLLSGDGVRVAMELTCHALVEPGSPGREDAIHPQLDVLHLDTTFEAQLGQTVAVAGILNMQDVLVLATVQEVSNGGGPPELRLTLQVAQ